MIFALILLAVIVGGYVYFVRKVKNSTPVVSVNVPDPVASAPAPAVAASEPNKQA
jgi:hypothetical protein